MYKVVTIDQRKIPMKSNGCTGRLYARYFHKDFLQTLFKFNDLEKNDVDFEVINELAWVLAKTANPSIKDIDEWLEQFETPFSVINAMPQMMELLAKGGASTVNAKKKVKEAKAQASTN